MGCGILTLMGDTLLKVFQRCLYWRKERAPIVEESNNQNGALPRQRLNPRRAAKLRKKMDKWFSGRNPETVEKEEVIVKLDLQLKEKKYSEAEIDSAFKDYKKDSRSDS